MLKLYRRHLKSCPHRSMTYRRCKCPIWFFGSVEDRRVRQALDTTSWDKGEEELRRLDPHEAPVKMTGKPVHLPLPADVVEDIRNLRQGDGTRIFWSGLSNPKSAVGNMQRS